MVPGAVAAALPSSDRPAGTATYRQGQAIDPANLPLPPSPAQRRRASRLVYGSGARRECQHECAATFRVAAGLGTHGHAEAVKENVRAVAAGSRENVTSNIGARFSSVDSGVTLTLAGQRLSLDEAASTLAAFDDGRRAWSDTAPGGEETDHGLGLGFDELLRTSAFEISLGAAEGESLLGGQWAVWGPGDVLFFDDDSDRRGRCDGDLKAGYLGVDAWLDDCWPAGVAASRIVVDSGYLPGGAGTGGQLEVTLTGVHSYLRYAPEARPEFRAIVGAGVGEIGDTRRGAGQETNDLRMLMSAAGARMGVLTPFAALRLAAAGESMRTGVRSGTARMVAGALKFELAGERRALDAGDAGDTEGRSDLSGRVGF